MSARAGKKKSEVEFGPCFIQQGYSLHAVCIWINVHRMDHAAVIWGARPCCTCASIHSYVFSRPTRSGLDGAQFSDRLIKSLSEHRPRTPVGPGICLIRSRFPAMSM